MVTYIIGVFLPFIYWGIITAHFTEKKNSKRILPNIKQILERASLKVDTYICKRAILFKEYEDEGIAHALEIEENKILFIWDNHDAGISYYLPNSKFEILKDEDVHWIFGRNINAIGEPIQPIIIMAEIKWEIWDDSPRHLETIPLSIEAFLDKLEVDKKNKEWC